MTSRTYGAVLVAVTISSCSLGIGDPTSDPQDGDVTLTTSATKYDWDGTGIEATLSNLGGQHFYARLGDGFSGEEQEQLFVAAGSDGYVERIEGDVWVALDRLVLIEGVRFVVLKPGASYTLFASFTGEKSPGDYRLRVEYFDSADGGSKVGEAVSNRFGVR